MAHEDQPAARRPDRAAGPATDPGIVLPFDPRPITAVAAVISVLLVVVGVTVALVYDSRNRATDRWLELVDVNGEANIPTWFSVTLLSAGAVAVAAVATRSRRRAQPDAAAWSFVALFLTAMSIDEMVGLHESVGGEVDDVVAFPLIGGYGWLVPGTLIGLVGAAVLWRAVVPLPAHPRNAIVLSIGLFGAGAVGLEVVEAMITDEDTTVGTEFFLVTGAQELLEMLGATLFLRTMLIELQRRTTAIDLRDGTAAAIQRGRERAPLPAAGEPSRR
jgi:hypothetical protein